MKDSSTVTPKRRRGFALGLLVTAAAIVVVTIVAAADEMYVWQSGGHIYVRPLAHPYLGVTLAAGMLVVAAQLAVQDRVGRIGAQVAVGFVTVVVLGFGALFSALDFNSVSGGSVVATSTDFKLVSYRSPGGFSFGRLVLRVQTRNGVASREGRDNVACFVAPGYGAATHWLFDHAAFEGTDGLATFAKDGTMERTRFDPRTLAAVAPLDRCAGAPVSD